MCGLINPHLTFLELQRFANWISYVSTVMIHMNMLLTLTTMIITVCSCDGHQHSDKDSSQDRLSFNLGMK